MNRALCYLGRAVLLVGFVVPVCVQLVAVGKYAAAILAAAMLGALSFIATDPDR